jgi:hypothetical protein
MVLALAGAGGDACPNGADLHAAASGSDPAPEPIRAAVGAVLQPGAVLDLLEYLAIDLNQRRTMMGQ